MAMSRRALKVAAELPSRLFLRVVAAGVIGGLALGTASVWLAAHYGAGRRR